MIDYIHAGLHHYLTFLSFSFSSLSYSIHLVHTTVERASLDRNIHVPLAHYGIQLWKRINTTIGHLLTLLRHSEELIHLLMLLRHSEKLIYQTMTS